MPTDETFPAFLAGLVPKNFCAECLALICRTDQTTILRRLEMLGDTVEKLSAPCQNCDQPDLTYRLKRTS
jgi:hypothetical protein